MRIRCQRKLDIEQFGDESYNLAKQIANQTDRAIFLTYTKGQPHFICDSVHDAKEERERWAPLSTTMFVYPDTWTGQRKATFFALFAGFL